MQYKNYVPFLLPLMAFIILFSGMNTALFLQINKAGMMLPDILWELFTTFGNKTFALVVLFLLFWKRPSVLVAALIASIFASLISSTLKPLFDLARPSDVLALSNYHLIGVKASGHSFPSGHTMSAFTIAATLVYLLKNRWLSVGVLILAGLVGLSRIMLGVHWPIDVLMGATIGLACGYAGVQLSQLEWLRNHKLMRISVTILYFLLAVKLLWRGTAYSDVQIMVKIVAIVGLLLGAGLIFKLLQSMKQEKSIKNKGGGYKGYKL